MNLLFRARWIQKTKLLCKQRSIEPPKVERRSLSRIEFQRSEMRRKFSFFIVEKSSNPETMKNSLLWRNIITVWHRNNNEQEKDVESFFLVKKERIKSKRFFSSLVLRFHQYFFLSFRVSWRRLKSLVIRQARNNKFFTTFLTMMDFVEDVRKARENYLCKKSRQEFFSRFIERFLSRWKFYEGKSCLWISHRQVPTLHWHFDESEW